MMFPKPVKQKKKNKTQDYKEVRTKYLKEHPTCEVCLDNDATQVHHADGRLGDRLTDPLYFFAVCHDCHGEIHANPKWAYEKGFLLERNRLV